MNGRGYKLLALLAILVLALGLSAGTQAAPKNTVLKTDSCPSGDGWTKIDSSDLSLYPVAGADDYCFKFGSVNSQGCDGGVSDIWPPPADQFPKPCGLSHWSYHMPEATATDTPEPPTATPTNTEEPPTATPTNTPGPSPTATIDPCLEHPEQCVTPTAPPPPHHEPKTGPGDALPFAGVALTLVLLGIAGASLRIALKQT